MPQIEIRLPKMGESVTEATITNWLKNVGDSVALDEPLVEVATDKVDNELPSEVAGILVQRLFEKNDVVKVGTVIAIISTGGDDSQTRPVNSAKPVAIPAKEVIASVTEPLTKSVNHGLGGVVANGSGGKFYSPLVRSIAKKEGISVAELESISGSGESNRVTKKDILSYLDQRGSGTSRAQKPVSSGVSSSTTVKSMQPVTKAEFHAPEIQIYPGDEIIEMDRMRKLIADHMVMSVHTSPHVTSYVEADVTNLVLWREKIKDQFLKSEGEKITFTPLFIEAVVKAIKDFPMVNVSVSGQNIIKRKHINIGMATALKSGNLIVPVIRDADFLNLVGLTKKVNDLAERARNGKLESDDIVGGTYTITNVGTFGNVMGTPIINQPQVAILATGAIRKVPAVIETSGGDAIVVRHKMYLSHSYDHRVVDGALGGMFVRRVADYLEQFDVNRSI